jgi:hypothetical protein
VHAEQQFQLATKDNPDLAEAHIALGMLYANAVRLDTSEQELRAGIRILERMKTTLVPGGDYNRSLSLAYGYLGYVQVE